MIEGVDYSVTAHANWDALAAAIKAAGNQFVGRYAVSDKAPNGRGIGAAEYAAMKRAGLDVFLYWEGRAEWMLGGYDVGVAAAQNAQANIESAGIPANIPIYFAHDIDPEPQHFDAIDACLRGCASVVGWERIGVYGGWLLMDYMAGGGTVQYLCQTKAWEYGRGLHPAADIYQFAFATNLSGTAMDDCRAYTVNYGQDTPPVIVEPPTKPKPVSIYPPGMTRQVARERFGRIDKKYGRFEFSEFGPVSRQWLKNISAQLKPGEDYTKATIGPLTSVIRRGGARSGEIDFGFAGMPTIKTKGGKVVE